MPYAKAFYSAQELGVAGRTHAAVFKALHDDHALPINGATVGELATFYAGYGVDAAKFTQAFDGPKVQARMDQAREFITAQRRRWDADAGGQRQVPRDRRTLLRRRSAHRRCAGRTRKECRQALSVIGGSLFSAALAILCHPSEPRRPPVADPTGTARAQPDAEIRSMISRLPLSFRASLISAALMLLPRRLLAAAGARTGGCAGHRHQPHRPRSRACDGGSRDDRTGDGGSRRAGRSQQQPGRAAAGPGPGSRHRLRRDRRRPAVPAGRRQDRGGRGVRLHLPALRPVRNRWSSRGRPSSRRTCSSPRSPRRSAATGRRTPRRSTPRSRWACSTRPTRRCSARSTSTAACRCSRCRDDEQIARVLRQVRRRPEAVRQHHVELRHRRQGQARQRSSSSAAASKSHARRSSSPASTA